MFYGIAVFPPTEIGEFADLYRRRYDPHYPLIKPHLTLRDKEAWDNEQLVGVISQLERAAEEVDPFELNFNRFSTFYPVNHVIYMALANPGPMVDLRNRICTELLSDNEKPYSYTPHVTVAQQLGTDELHDVLSSLRNTSLSLECTIDRFSLLRQEPNGSWSPIREFSLL
ncbi:MULTISPECIES: 2'-5' RNA ligase family protein [unclassified Paenibacillus]|uniref:2'-5' RNA ligase family protein n=1 Tax=unclassified Paenibacillus TaxID=185978 RepID=UPI001AEAD18A|nr:MULTISPECIES: 2'-5' RNA ligase family protein [unclassified Paenibacillus]MBP1156207.1 2'-5' RNA ligase [Paenibacillus sp. PvP091]MBP1168407.1 2'-5' RNA ligase [Paenibacillus sp. PvR098]MBP2439435.1 2'-5' RNA ligase [Paenibacillus sp. PvP052]